MRICRRCFVGGLEYHSSCIHSRQPPEQQGSDLHGSDWRSSGLILEQVQAQLFLQARASAPWRWCSPGCRHSSWRCAVATSHVVARIANGGTYTANCQEGHLHIQTNGGNAFQKVLGAEKKAGPRRVIATLNKLTKVKLQQTHC